MAYRVTMNRNELHVATAKGCGKGLRRAGAYARKVARHSIRKSKNKSTAGMPPHTRYGRLKNAIEFYADDAHAIIGPRHDKFGDLANLHEFGGVQIRRKSLMEDNGGKFVYLKKKRKTYRVGSSGPIRVGDTPVFTRLLTQAQVDRATRIDADYWREPPMESATYPARPFMKPALEKTAQSMEKFFKDVIK